MNKKSLVIKFAETYEIAYAIFWYRISTVLHLKRALKMKCILNNEYIDYSFIHLLILLLQNSLCMMYYIFVSALFKKTKKERKKKYIISYIE